MLGALPPIQTNTITQNNADSFTFGRVTHGFSIGSGSSIGGLKPIGARENIDLNTVYGPFLGSVSSSTNLPDLETNGVVIAIDPVPTSSHDRTVQFFVRDECVYYRIRWQDWSQSGSPIIWHSWHKLWPQT